MNNKKWISREAIVEIGMMRKMGICGWCGQSMDMKNHNIQLCRSCRKEHLDETMKGHGIDCDCDNCQKIKDLLKNKEKSGDIHLAGTKEDLQKIRGDQ